jgi:hypothetical protein
MSSLAFAIVTLVTMKIKEQSGNVIEKKGALWKTRRLTGNVIENKGLIGMTRECC